MPLPAPEPGLVVSYAYLWRWQDERGDETGDKPRPAVVVLVSGPTPDVMAVPVTTQPVAAERDAIDVPRPVAAHLGLDTSRMSRIVADEVNMFHWPNDLQPVPGQPPGVFHYGFIPPKLFRTVREAVVRNHRQGDLVTVKRRG